MSRLPDPGRTALDQLDALLRDVIRRARQPRLRAWLEDLLEHGERGCGVLNGPPPPPRRHRRKRRSKTKR